MNAPRILTAIGLALVLGGFATMSAEDCSSADWRMIGFDDGARGEPLTRAERRERDCTKHGVAMDRQSYDAGRHDGLATYCTEGVAYQLGESGRSYNGVCADHDESTFLAAYERGRELYAFTAAVATAAEQHRAATARHDELDARLDKYWGGYRDEGLTLKEHNEMVLDLWAERKYLATTAIPYWQQAEAALRRELDDYRSRVAAADPAVGTNLSPTAYAGPDPYRGPTEADAREMLKEVFSTLSTASNG